MSEKTLLEIIKSMKRSEAVQWIKRNHGVPTRLAMQIVAVELGEATFGDTKTTNEAKTGKTDKKRFLCFLKRRRLLKKRTLSW